MVNPSASLSELLHARALSTAPSRLWLDLAVGITVVAVAVWIRPIGWVALASAGLCFAMYGLWSVSERQLQPDDGTASSRARVTWRVVHGITTLLGLIALVALLFALLGLTLGTWIS